MRNLILCLSAWLCAMAFIVAANPAQAGIVTYVSNTGSDSNNCETPATACADVYTALAHTDNYGEVNCLNTGSYLGNLTIAQSVTIDCAGSVGLSQGLITLNGAGIVVRLRNLSFDNGAYGHFGIDAQNVAALYVENCIITNFNPANANAPFPPFLGIKFEPSAGEALLSVTNTIISNNGNTGSGITGGIYIAPGSGVTATVSINRSEINGNTFGIVGDGRSGGTIHATIRDSVVSGNSSNGITAISSGSSTVFLVDQTEVSGNLAGLFVSGSNAGMLARNSTVYGNSIGLDAAGGGTLYTYGNNSVNGNTTNGAFTGTVGLQ